MISPDLIRIRKASESEKFKQQKFLCETQWRKLQKNFKWKSWALRCKAPGWDGKTNYLQSTGKQGSSNLKTKILVYVGWEVSVWKLTFKIKKKKKLNRKWQISSENWIQGDEVLQELCKALGKELWAGMGARAKNAAEWSLNLWACRIRRKRKS